MKPGTRTAMANLIAQVREVMPFESPGAQICGDSCSGCPLKLLDFLQVQLEEQEHRLSEGEIPNFRDLHQLGKTSQKVYRVLQKNRLVL